ncbi:hypothetical protein NPIL_411031 [Nephila pilipes]|uniref:Uncharacterized protein n=1 Tax=Nephila pilipes TaxID=299642 RepID=A0A8X6IK63_NEPPI|nr:hypothetical protein NPIL_411031 [Nephila pilipes]
MRGSNDTKKCQLSETSASAHLLGHLPWEIVSQENTHSIAHCDVHLVFSHLRMISKSLSGRRFLPFCTDLTPHSKRWVEEKKGYVQVFHSKLRMPYFLDRILYPCQQSNVTL